MGLIAVVLFGVVEVFVWTWRLTRLVVLAQWFARLVTALTAAAVAMTRWWSSNDGCDRCTVHSGGVTLVLLMLVELLSLSDAVGRVFVKSKERCIK